ncbi:MAG: HD domain-containing phosphohydrolase [Pseudomonadota bacterium]|nr:HD domain-containing phosphohydrolase [Pseudomonadota bacterium]MDP1905678.1 HD domain-containing phosphohydrolase [Pseudomonadota bacterium]MDP2353550.1 HD domain-containing phosphohydrolase [Pseudomonadota bacterium]
MLRPVQLDTALIGQPLPWDLYTGAGVLVAGTGLVLADEAHFNRLSARALFRKGDGAATDTPFERLAVLAKQAESVLENPDEGAIREVARALLALERADADACLGYSNLVSLARPSVNHALRVLFIAGLLAEQLDFSEAEQESLAAAALTMNVGGLDLHDRLHAYAGQVPETDRVALRGHPRAGASLLERAGVTDTAWLETVRQHHENMDGSGYPAGLSGNMISLAARLLRVADFYCAKVGGRYYRPPRSASFAFQELFGREKVHLDSQIAAQLLRRLGIYPPGTLVRLASRETACVARRAQAGEARWAVSILDARDRLLEPPQTRDLGTRNYAIIGTAECQPSWPTINWMAVWGY